MRDASAPLYKSLSYTLHPPGVTIFYFLSTSQGIRIHCTHTVHVQYANFAVINFNNTLTSRLLNSLCIYNIPGIFIKLFCIYCFRSRYNALHLNGHAVSGGSNNSVGPASAKPSLVFSVDNVPS